MSQNKQNVPTLHSYTKIVVILDKVLRNLSYYISSVREFPLIRDEN